MYAPESNLCLFAEKFCPNDPQMEVKPHNHSARRINAIAEIAGARSYLEIGVRKGKTFLDVNLDRKVAVDPYFMFDFDGRPDNEEYFALTSDDYFAKHAESRLFDIIFVDGLHTFEQSLRDFCNSIFLAHKRTVWLLDDTVPSDMYSAWPNQSEATKARRQDFGPAVKGWSGDVFKVVFAIHDFFPRLSYRTITGGGKGQTVVWSQPRHDFVPIFNNMEKIARMSYFEFRNHEEILLPRTESETIEELAVFLGRQTPNSSG